MITIAKDQAWFWSQEWQEEEQKADEDISKNAVSSFNNVDDALAFLHSDEE